MEIIGYAALWITALLSIYVVVGGFIAGKHHNRRLVCSVENAVGMTTLMITIAVACLEFLLLTHDFSIRYVAEYTSRHMPFFYTATALWGGQAGSLLLWVWLLSIFSFMVVRQNQDRNRDIIAYVYAVLFCIVVFFSYVLIFMDNPFAKLFPTPPDGRGLNPLLQNPFMVIHPPMLYVGFVGLAIPFAFAMSAMMKRKLNNDWIRTTRRWTIFSWTSLTLGIILGAQWAYVELGWGGYWAWDPVENASLLPWLVATAYLHSVMIQEKKSMLKMWNMFLIVVTFLLTLFGTFLTRSGLITSVHAFAQSMIGYYFLGFIVVVAIWAGYLMVTRRKDLQSEHAIESFFSREAAFLLNNIVLLAITFTVIWGTLFPVISEAVRGTKITVGPPYFNKVTLPMWILLLALTGLGPVLAWKKTSARKFLNLFWVPILIAVLGLVMAALFLTHNVYVILTVTLSVFVVTTVGLEMKKGSGIIAKNTKRSFLSALLVLIMKNRRRYGGYIIHLGVVCIFLGISGSAFKREITQTLYPSQTLEIKPYSLRYDRFVMKPGANFDEITAVSTLFKSGQAVAQMFPAKQFHHTFDEQPTTEVSLRSSVMGDIYLFVAGFDAATQGVTFTLMIYPLVTWNWIGAAIMLIGAFIAVLPGKKKELGQEVVGSTM